MTHNYIFFLGSHPELSAAESYAALSTSHYTPRFTAGTREFLLVTLDRELPPNFLRQLGGTKAIAKLVGRQPQPYSAEQLFPHLEGSSAPKLTLGLSALGLDKGDLKDLAQELKSIAKEHRVRLRFLLPRGRSSQLNSAQVLFNQLTSAPNRELTIIKNEQEYVLAKTIAVQDIAAYEVRDTQRPVRDARIGMLPPKLAQIMLNLAVGSSSSGLRIIPPLDGTPPTAVADNGLRSATILDPFCGTGTILQEGWIAGHTMVGSDINADMVEASTKNLAWVAKHSTGSRSRYQPQQGSGVLKPRTEGQSSSTRGTWPSGTGAKHATVPPTIPSPEVFLHDIRQPFPQQWHAHFDAIVTEPYLGKPLKTPLPSREAEKYIAPLADLYLNFFQNATPLLKKDGYILLLLPAFRRGHHKDAAFSLLPQTFLDAVKETGYSLEQLIPQELQPFYPPSSRGTLLYSRPDALVGRELTLWKKR